MPQATIHVLPRPYQASIENGLLSRAGSVLDELLPNASRVFVVTVAPVRKRWGCEIPNLSESRWFQPADHHDAGWRTCQTLETVEGHGRETGQDWARTASP